MDGESWCHTDQDKLKITSLLIWLLDFQQVRSRLELHAGPRDWQSTINFSESNKNWETREFMQVQTSDTHTN